MPPKIAHIEVKENPLGILYINLIVCDLPSNTKLALQVIRPGALLGETLDTEKSDPRGEVIFIVSADPGKNLAEKGVALRVVSVVERFENPKIFWVLPTTHTGWRKLLWNLNPFNRIALLTGKLHVNYSVAEAAND